MTDRKDSLVPMALRATGEQMAAREDLGDGESRQRGEEGEDLETQGCQVSGSSLLQTPAR